MAVGSPEFVLRRMEEARLEHEFSARRARLLDVGLLLAALGILVTGLLIYAFFSATSELGSAFVPWITGTIIVASIVVATRQWLAPRQRYVIHAKAARALAREPALFEARAGSYADGETPTAVLAERLAQIEVQAEDALLDPRES